MDLSELGRRLAAQRKKQAGVCAVCGQPFERIGSRTKYCSDPCARKAVYQANAEQIKAKRRERYRARRAQPTGQGTNDA